MPRDTLFAAIEKPLAVVGSILSILAIIVPATFYLASINPDIQANATAVTKLEATVTANVANDKAEREAMQRQFQSDQEKQNARVDRIQEERTVNVQRLSKVEEAVQATNSTLEKMDNKLDRVLMRR